MKCKACGSDDVTQSKGKCNECLWVYEQERKRQDALKMIMGEKPRHDLKKRIKEIADSIKFETSIEFIERIGREKNK